MAEIDLKSIPLFRELNHAQLQQISEHTDFFVSYAPDESIIEEGKEGCTLYVLISGSAYVSKQDGNETKTIAMLQEGDTFGEMSFVSKRKRSTSVIAADDVVVLQLDEASLVLMGHALADSIKNQIIEILIHRLEKMNETLMHLTRFVPHLS